MVAVTDLVDWQRQLSYGRLKVNSAQPIPTKHKKNVYKMARDIFKDIFGRKNYKDH